MRLIETSPDKCKSSFVELTASLLRRKIHTTEEPILNGACYQKGYFLVKVPYHVHWSHEKKDKCYIFQALFSEP